MSDTVLVALVTGGCTLAAAAVSAFAALCISARKYENRNLLSRLRTALLELQAFQKLETAYTDALVAASADSTAKAAKLRIRKAVRDQGFDSPSPEAGEQRIANALKALDQT